MYIVMFFTFEIEWSSIDLVIKCEINRANREVREDEVNGNIRIYWSRKYGICDA